MLCADLVEVRWKDREGKTQKAQAILEDISAAGACLQVEAPIPLGTEVSWRSPKKEFHGDVRYCTYREIGYFVGVQLHPASRWSKKIYRPQHLLDLKRLMAQHKQ